MCYKKKSAVPTIIIIFFNHYCLLLFISSKNLAIGYLNEPSQHITDAKKSKKALIKLPSSKNSSAFRHAYIDTPKKDKVLIQSP